MIRIFALCMALAMMSGCGAGAQEPAGQPLSPPPTVDDEAAEDLMQGIAAHAPETDGALTEQGAATLTDFGVRLLQGCLEEGENTLVSPLSVMEALGMTANGASGQTLAQTEQVLGFAVGELNDALYIYTQGLPDGEGGSVRLANGIWLNTESGFQPEQDFLQVNGDYYGAAMRQQAFDASLTEEINAWVDEHTAGRIERILDGTPDAAMAYLVNALAFDGTWENIYREDQIRPGTFTDASGQEQQAQFMWSTELGALRDGDARGFIKYYQDRDYAFAAILPGEGTTPEAYAASLTGEKLQKLLAEADGSVFVETAIPKFTAEYGADLAPVLAAMGMTDAFDGAKADLSRMGRCAAGNLYISRVMHKTFINVDEKGTQAGAATAVEVQAAGTMGPMEQVHLTRPFVYMLIDCQNSVPVFLGVVNSLG